MTSGALTEMRSLLHELRPGALSQVQLSKLIEQLAMAFSNRTAIDTLVNIQGIASLDSETQVALYRIVQETLNNVAKHARAKVVKIEGSVQSDKVEIKVIDDGRGFNVESVPKGKYGLSIMKERAGNIGAKLDIMSEPTNGTTVAIAWEK